MVKVYCSIQDDNCLELFLIPVPHYKMAAGDNSTVWRLNRYWAIKSLLLSLAAKEIDNAHELLRIAIVAERLQKEYYKSWITQEEREHGLVFMAKSWEKALRLVGTV